ncbi:MAG TPA: hypothetical protein VFC46_03360, partial [Humisphaera sp.]|nr:hypothetical protein [Humisphaera sp.]
DHRRAGGDQRELSRRRRIEPEHFSVPPVPSPAEGRDEETIPPARAPAALKTLSLIAEHFLVMRRIGPR